MTRELPSADLLRKLLRYEPDTGKLFWRERTPDMFPQSPRSAEHNCAVWNGRYAETEAFTAVKSRGYLHGNVLRKTCLAHRVAWAIHNGEWPKLHIDHIDGNQRNNRASNLRQATSSENGRNSRSAKGSVSKFLGVGFKKANGKWTAQVQVGGRRVHVGYFATEDDAARAYDAAARLHYGQFANPNFPLIHNP
jgi:hypothetical protein